MAFQKGQKTWKWTRGEKREALIADLAILPNDEIAGKYGVSGTTVARYRVKYHVPSPVPFKGQKITPEIENEIIRLKREEKYTYAQICETLGVNRNRVEYVLNAKKKKRAVPAIHITKKNAIPAFYDNTPDTFEFDEPEDRRRYERLRAWKIKNAKKREKKIYKSGSIYLADDEDAVY